MNYYAGCLLPLPCRGLTFSEGLRDRGSRSIGAGSGIIVFPLGALLVFLHHAQEVVTRVQRLPVSFPQRLCSNKAQQ